MIRNVVDSGKKRKPGSGVFGSSEGEADTHWSGIGESIEGILGGISKKEVAKDWVKNKGKEEVESNDE
jgi:hypothetical protein